MKHRFGPYYYTWAAVRGFYGSYLRDPVRMKVELRRRRDRGRHRDLPELRPLHLLPRPRGPGLRGASRSTRRHALARRPPPGRASATSRSSPRRVLGSRSTAGDHRQIDHFDGITEARIESASRDEDGAWRPFPVQVDGDYIGQHGELDLGVDPGALQLHLLSRGRARPRLRLLRDRRRRDRGGDRPRGRATRRLPRQPAALPRPRAAGPPRAPRDDRGPPRRAGRAAVRQRPPPRRRGPRGDGRRRAPSSR